MAAPVRADVHGIPHVNLATLPGVYATKHPGLLVADNATVRLDPLNEPQPDLLLMREDGPARMDDEFVEIAAEPDGLMASAEFPGLVIDSRALTSGDLAAARARLG